MWCLNEYSRHLGLERWGWAFILLAQWADTQNTHKKINRLCPLVIVMVQWQRFGCCTRQRWAEVKLQTCKTKRKVTPSVFLFSCQVEVVTVESNTCVQVWSAPEMDTRAQWSQHKHWSTSKINIKASIVLDQQTTTNYPLVLRTWCAHMALCLCLCLCVSLLHVWCARKLGWSACTRHEWQSWLHIATSNARPLSISSTLLIRVILSAGCD